MVRGLCKRAGMLELGAPFVEVAGQDVDLTQAWSRVFPKSGSLLDVCDDPVYANVRGVLLYARSAAATSQNR